MLIGCTGGASVCLLFGLFQRFICFFCDWFEPFIRTIFPWHFYCEMGKPAIWCCAVPVLYTWLNVDAITWLHLDGILAPFLVVPAAGDTNQNLSAALIGMVSMPVVTAAWLKSHIEYFHL